MNQHEYIFQIVAGYPRLFLIVLATLYSSVNNLILTLGYLSENGLVLQCVSATKIRLLLLRLFISYPSQHPSFIYYLYILVILVIKLVVLNPLWTSISAGICKPRRDHGMMILCYLEALQDKGHKNKYIKHVMVSGIEAGVTSALD